MCEYCFNYYASLNSPIPLHRVIVADIRGTPNKLYRFVKTDTCTKLFYHDLFLTAGMKNLLYTVTEYEHRYHLHYPQLVQLDERYFCLLGGS
jgi:hypothetical protein